MAEGWLEAFFEQHIARRAITAQPSLFQDPREKAFYRALVRELFPRGWLRFAVVQFNEEPIASHFGFEFGGRFLWYKPSFEPRLVKRSPGEVLLRFLLGYAIDQKLAEFDFTVGDEDFKYRFANEVRFNQRLQVWTSPSRRALARMRQRVAGLWRRLREPRARKASGSTPGPA